jgi:hypothetical protein
MATFNLLLGDSVFTVSKKDILNHCKFFDIHSDLYSQQSYRVQTDVPVDIFRQFIAILQKKQSISITIENVLGLSRLADEFSVPSLHNDCRIVMAPIEVSARLSAIESSIAEFSHFRASAESRLRDLESRLASEISALKADATPAAVCETPWKEIPVPFGSSGELKGILSLLSSRQGGNAHDLKIMTITASSERNRQYPAKMLCDSKPKGYFCTADGVNQWICFDFQDRAVLLTHYAIKSARPGYLRSWVLECSEDGDGWETLDEHTNDPKLCTDQPMVFPVTMSEERCFLRIRQTGKNDCGTRCLVVSHFELFGTLLE